VPGRASADLARLSYPLRQPQSSKRGGSASDYRVFHAASASEALEGLDTYAIGRAFLRVEGAHVELALDVPAELWRRFEG